MIDKGCDANGQPPIAANPQWIHSRTDSYRRPRSSRRQVSVAGPPICNWGRIACRCSRPYDRAGARRAYRYAFRGIVASPPGTFAMPSLTVILHGHGCTATSARASVGVHGRISASTDRRRGTCSSIEARPISEPARRRATAHSGRRCAWSGYRFLSAPRRPAYRTFAPHPLPATKPNH